MRRRGLCFLTVLHFFAIAGAIFVDSTWLAVLFLCVCSGSWIYIIRAAGRQSKKIEPEKPDLQEGDFVNFVAHELKTPLTSIRMSSSLLLHHNQLPGEKQRDFMLTLRRECLRLEKMLDNVLDFLRIEAGNFKPGFSHCNLETIVADAGYLYEEKLGIKRMSVSS